MSKVLTVLGDPARLFRTVRYLRTRQIVNRVTRKIFRPGPPVKGGRAPKLRSPRATWRNCSGRPPSMLSPERFQFLGEIGELQNAASWNDPHRAKLWLYNLHYFDDLRAQNAATRSSWHYALINRWILENAPTAGNGWEPYPSSLRIVNWIAWALAGNEPGEAARDSLAAQTRNLSATIEHHLLGNHLLANAKALVFAGCYFGGNEAAAWLRNGLNLLNQELHEQILKDGGHFELSPMYHAIILEDMLDLIQLAGIFPEQLAEASDEWRPLAARMLSWLASMSHPDGEISFFNDAAFGIARTHRELEHYAKLLELSGIRHIYPLCRLDQSGYVRLQSGPFFAIFDAAEIGPSYLPGHGHADVLSIEASLDGRRFITNSGVSTYACGKARKHERSTAAHSTVEIDGHDSSEVWGSFRVGRRARPLDLATSITGDTVTASAWHDGYRWLSGAPAHYRDVVLSPTSLAICDHVTGDGSYSVIGRFLLHPSVRTILREATAWRIELPEKRIVRVTIAGGVESFLSKGYYAPSFGQRIERPVLEWRYVGRPPLKVETRFEL